MGMRVVMGMKNSDGDESSNGDENSDGDESDVDESSDGGNTNDYIILLKDIPTQFFFIETLEGTLEDVLDTIDQLNTELIRHNQIFQMLFALMYMQKHFTFTHNDLHINNIMYRATEKTYLYYKLNNIYFKDLHSDIYLKLLILVDQFLPFIK